ncbi:Zinc finger protein 26 [Exaiptasia diaphana]|nr:Zinc finger protein 26 [Exaiptasia diaphana]
METNWIQYKCKSGHTLLVYDKRTGQFKWPSMYPSGENSTTVILGEPVISKELCTTATQTDDVGCINGCTSMYISTSHIVNNKETSSREIPAVVDEVADNLDIELGVGNGLDDDGNEVGEDLEVECDLGNGSDDGEIVEKSADMDTMTRSHMENDGNRFNKDSIEAVRHIQTFHNYTIPTHTDDTDDIKAASECSYEESDGDSEKDNLNETIQVNHSFQEQLKEHGMKLFKCGSCEDTFICNYLLENHVARMHTQERPFECSYCKKTFLSQKNLNGHIQTTHVRVAMQKEEKLLECCYCKKKLKGKKILTEHVRTHTGEKPFQCSYCQKKFARKHVLKDHLRVHTGEKPFECFLCKKKYRHKKTLRDHLKAHTGERTFECSFCKKKFVLKKGLNEHVKRHIRRSVQEVDEKA